MQTTASEPTQWTAAKIVYVLLLCAGYAYAAYWLFFMFRTVAQ